MLATKARCGTAIWRMQGPDLSDESGQSASTPTFLESDPDGGLETHGKAFSWERPSPTES